jgi:prepilin-type N-terminal cleavage/methylation domain-containing protein
MRDETATKRHECPVEAAVPAAMPSRTQAARLPLQRVEFLPETQRNYALRTAHTTPRRTDGFTLAELLVAVAVLVVLVVLFAQLLKSAATITTLGHGLMDADSQARQLLDRMAIDLAQMVKRSDVDYYVKSSAASPLRHVLQPGNDQVAFYSTVPGYYPSTGAQSPLSLVAYRVNSGSSASVFNKMERLGKGLVWNAVSTTDTPVVFIPIPVAAPLSLGDVVTQTPTPTPTPAANPAWPQAGNMAADPSYELVGSQVFRFEYYYLLKNGSLSDVPWDTSAGHYSVEGMQDVSAIIVDIAVVDPKSKVLLTDAQLARLNGADSQPPTLIDWGNTSCAGCPTQMQWQRTPGLLVAQWRTALDANATDLGLPTISGIRLYERYLYLSPPTLLTP